MKLKGSISLTRQNKKHVSILSRTNIKEKCTISRMMGKALPKYSKHSIQNSLLFVSLHLMLCVRGSGQSKSPVAVMRVD